MNAVEVYGFAQKVTAFSIAKSAGRPLPMKELSVKKPHSFLDCVTVVANATSKLERLGVSAESHQPPCSWGVVPTKGTFLRTLSVFMSH